MARLPVAGENTMIQALLPTAGTFYLTLHSADPGTTGASEFTTVTRQAFTPSTAASGAVSNTNTITVPNGNTQAATYVGIWTAATAGTYVIGAPLSSSVTAASIVFNAGAASFSCS